MAITKINIEAFISASKNQLIIDVRSPSEYSHAHIPNAISLPLFSDEERKIVGTAYKQKSRQEAIKLGLDYFGVKMKPMVEQVEKLIAEHQKNNEIKSTIIYVHCWRGGMRSGAVSWLLDLYGFKVCQLVGGYKAYRNYVLQQFQLPISVKIIGGKTGSGKTFILHALKNLNQNVIDLEGLAHHKGSAFGALGEPKQPTQEQFENNLCNELANFLLPNSTIYVEDESQRIGAVNIPNPLWLQMRNAEVLYIDLPFEERLKHIISGYGKCNIEKLKEATIRIAKRLGGLEFKIIFQLLEEQNIEKAFFHLLQYYDREYEKAEQRREQHLFNRIKFTELNLKKITEKILLK
ncbi:MAG: tRNA 2-selenouridine(34) synthase MnmH [Bacteroidota bacterium]